VQEHDGADTFESDLVIRCVMALRRTRPNVLMDMVVAIYKEKVHELFMYGSDV
jgi:hypothetical protein